MKCSLFTCVTTNTDNKIVDVEEEGLIHGHVNGLSFVGVILNTRDDE